jgi:hypothetical protein
MRREGDAVAYHNRPPFTKVALAYAPERDVQGPHRTVMVNPRVLEGETDTETMDFPEMRLEDAAKAFTEAAYGKPITLEGA